MAGTKIVIPCNSVGCGLVMRPFVCCCVSGCVRLCVHECVRLSVALCLVGTIHTLLFARSLSNITCKLWMMRGGSLLIFGLGVKSQVQLWYSVCKAWLARYVICTVFPRSLSNFTYKFWMRRGPLLIFGHEFKGQGQLWHSVYMTLLTRYDYSFCPFTFKLPM